MKHLILFLTCLFFYFAIDTIGRYTVGGNLLRPLPVLGNNFNNPAVYEFKLYSNYPNPFNPKTLIKFDIAGTAFVKVSIYNILGQLVSLLVNERKDAGNYSVEFDGSNMPSGLYIYKIEADDYIEAKKMLLVK